MVELTKAEEQMMHYLWKLGEGTVQDVMALMNEEKRPSRTTVSTIIRLLEDKGVVGHKSAGRGYIYYPVLKKEDYSRKRLKDVIKRYFDNSFSSLACFFVRENNLSIQELDELLEEIKKGSEK